ncbi:MAG TPA: histidinol-phosphate transaminase [Prochlorococcaceae cyanobacterium AMR_MDS_5431]|nr:histidinol-phosphate transaminase [Prochlorococcaceae cyanobacterium AMR_MDS_5431]
MSLGAPIARLEVEALEGYSAPLEGRRGLLRLDFNENTIGPTPLVVKTIRDTPADSYAIYPEYDGLREKLISSLGITNILQPSQIGVFNGVDAALHAICHAFGAPDEKMLITSPTFGYYVPCARMQGMKLEAIPHTIPDLNFPFKIIRTSLATTRILVICNPNNPTGTRLQPEQVIELATASPSTLIVVDELYETFTGDSILPLLIGQMNGKPPCDENHNLFSIVPNLLILRSLSKTAGLAGLRLGFAIGHSDLIDRIGRVTGPYDVNSFAISAAFCALSDQYYLDAYVSEVLQARAWLIHSLKLGNVCYHSKGGNYILIWPKSPVDQVCKYLRQNGILVRSMSNKPQINGSLRLSIGTVRQMQYFWLSYLQIENSIPED